LAAYRTSPRRATRITPLPWCRSAPRRATIQIWPGSIRAERNRGRHDEVACGSGGQADRIAAKTQPAWTDDNLAALDGCRNTQSMTPRAYLFSAYA
jgi:hypothetical protein